MDIGTIKAFDTVLGAPENWDAEKLGPCSGLPIRLIDGWQVSEWLPTAAELRDIADGGSVRLWVRGPHPVVSVTAEPPLRPRKRKTPAVLIRQEKARHERGPENVGGMDGYACGYADGLEFALAEVEGRQPQYTTSSPVECGNPNIKRYAAELFVWFYEDGIMGGCEYTAESAAAALKRHQALLDGPDQLEASHSREAKLQEMVNDRDSKIDLLRMALQRLSDVQDRQKAICTTALDATQ